MYNKYNSDIIEVLQDYVNKFAKDNWNGDKCIPEFRVSILNEDMDVQKILLTVSHLGSSFTHVLFPRNDSYYGYESIKEMMVDLYNRTM